MKDESYYRFSQNDVESSIGESKEKSDRYNWEEMQCYLSLIENGKWLDHYYCKVMIIFYSYSKQILVWSLWVENMMSFWEI